MEMGRKLKSEIEMGAMLIMIMTVIVFGYIATRAALARIYARREISTVVVDCERVEGAEYYEVVVQEQNGEEWAYYADDPKGIGTEVVIGMNGNNEITEAYEGEN